MRILLFFLALLFSANIFASVGYPGLSLSAIHRFILDDYEDDLYGVSQSKTSSNFTVAKLNYTLNSGAFFGLVHSAINDTITDAKNYGIDVGYSWNGLSFGFSYFFGPKRKDTLSNVTHTGGTFYILDIAYHYKIWDFFLLGANISYIHEDYKLAETLLSTTNSNFNYTTIQPFVSIGFLFNFYGNDYSEVDVNYR
mgnify:CR=1 FL=1